MRRLEPVVSTIDRSAELRTSPADLVRLWNLPHTKIVRVQRNHVAITDDRLELISPRDGERYFLGISDGVAIFAIRDESEGEQWKSLREIGHLLAPQDLEIATHAIALVNWHSSHPRCPRCGATTESDLGGSIRRCTADGSEHYPRTDPAIIVLIRDKDDRILLGRQAVWPEKRYSTFAGFVEPGESFESAVAREVKEEAGVDVHDVEYLGSQPWPFPASVMIAFAATTHTPETARPDGSEIESVLWFSKDELKAAVEAGEILLPPGISIARRMIEGWYGASLQGGSAWR